MIEKEGGHCEWVDQGGSYYWFPRPNINPEIFVIIICLNIKSGRNNLDNLAEEIRDTCKGIIAEKMSDTILRLKDE